MQIVSYRGPFQAGGVAALIQQASNYNKQSIWWHMHNNYLQSRSTDQLSCKATIPESIIDGHYRYCNEFLWPLMHERPELAIYDQRNHISYRSLNMAVAAHMNWYCNWQPTFIHDYQFALLPHYLREHQSPKSVFFWHIPWPATCPSNMISKLKEIAKGLLDCPIIGFHIKDYVRNFCSFIREFLPEFYVLVDDTAVIHTSGKLTELVAHPAGIDWAYWNNASKAITTSCPYILSVDRADYTKGIMERISAIQNIFHSHSELKGKLQFVFVCQQTRNGLAAFDEYWTRCRISYQDTLKKFACDNWSPIVWLSDAITPEMLAPWYAQAKAMLVNPSIDGLNLTAKEFVASATDPESALILSKGAGAWHELGQHTVTINKCHPQDIAEAILKALHESSAHKRTNLNALKQTVRANSLESWWHKLAYGKHQRAALYVRNSA